MQQNNLAITHHRCLAWIQTSKMKSELITLSAGEILLIISCIGEEYVCFSRFGELHLYKKHVDVQK